MQMQQSVGQEQRQILSQALQQSLQYLQMPMMELAEYLQGQSLSNPLLEVELTPLVSRHMVQISVIEDSGGYKKGNRKGAEQLPDAISYNTKPESFSDHLTEQINCMPRLDATIRGLCCFLIGCLDSTGYLSCDLAELAKELKIPLYDIEQALYLLQMLEPAGVGARDITECLLLQLARGKDFNTTNIRMIREGLPLLAKRDYTRLSLLLGVSVKEVYDSETIIKSLNPIPSWGFYSGDTYHSYIVPEATITCQNGQFVVEMNTRSLPKIRLSREYCAMLGDAAYDEVQDYLRERLAAAKEIITQVDSRQATLSRLLSVVIQHQEGYFLRHETLRPLTMQQVADELSLSTSTVSRAVKDKYIQYNSQMIPLRSLFTLSLQGSNGKLISADTAKQQLQLFIRAEDSSAPMSDEALVAALAKVGISISRRTVAKYRAALNIPSAAVRKRQIPQDLLTK